MERRLPFERGVNFRDLGGYETVDGRRVKWRKLFRCGHLSTLSEADQALLESLRLGAVIDFRTASEDEKRSSLFPQSLKDRRIRLNIWPKSSRALNDILRLLAAGEIDDDDICQSSDVVYREFVTDFTAEYAQMFRHLKSIAGAPTLIHCTAGKDRTGLGAALILVALGVPEKTIFEDYLVTNTCPILRSEIFEIVRAAMPMSEPDEARFMHLLGAREDSLQAALDAMIELSGSVEGYLRDALGVTDADRARFATLVSGAGLVLRGFQQLAGFGEIRRCSAHEDVGDLFRLRAASWGLRPGRPGRAFLCTRPGSIRFTRKFVCAVSLA